MKNTSVTVRIEKVVYGGQGLARDADGRVVFVWGALEGELVRVRYTKVKKNWADAIAEEVIEPSAHRIAPCDDDSYMSTSPWQIMGYDQEGYLKESLLRDCFHDTEIRWEPFYSPKDRYEYRNKMEYNFWYDTESHTLSLALHKRGSHFKIAVRGSSLAMKSINEAGDTLIQFLNTHHVGGRQLKSAVIRSTQDNTVSVVLYVTDKILAKLPWKECKLDIAVVYSDPKSPASVATERLREPQSVFLEDKVMGHPFRYSAEGFFQVNVPVYEQTLRDMSLFVDNNCNVVDMYAGVGSIGLSLPFKTLKSIETDKYSHEQARYNAKNKADVEVIYAKSEDVCDAIGSEMIVIVDPPRAGLHKKLISCLSSVRPKRILYLSCNPMTQARDCTELFNAGYKSVYARGYNFFPATPHIESLIVLERNDINV